MADATLPKRNHRHRAQTSRAVVELIPADQANSWHVAIFRDRHLKCSRRPKTAELLPTLLGAIDLDGAAWEHNWHWPQETNPYLEIERIGSVYYIEAEGLNLVKIGYSIEPLVRMTVLQEQSPVTLRLLYTCTGDRKLEHELHRRFAEHRHRGEWFRITPEIMAFMQTEIQDAQQLYARLALPWEPRHPAPMSTVEDLVERQADYALSPAIRSGSVMRRR
jgi:hypothetical protein